MRQIRKPIRELLNDERLMSQALDRATRDAIRRHKQAGVPMSIWRDGKVVLVPAEELEAELDRAGEKENGESSNGAGSNGG